MAKSKSALKYFKHGKESQTVQAGTIFLVLGAVLLLYLVAAKFNYFG